MSHRSPAQIASALHSQVDVALLALACIQTSVESRAQSQTKQMFNLFCNPCIRLT